MTDLRALFRKKPVVISAWQLTEERALAHLIDDQPLPDGLMAGQQPLELLIEVRILAGQPI